MRIQPSKEDLIHLTKLNPFDRFDDGRPRVPDEWLERMKLVNAEEAWAVLLNHGYKNQFVGGFMQTHPGKVLVGRALTASFLPYRPDYNEAIQTAGTAEGRGKIVGQNSWIIEQLQLNDVMVVDLRGMISSFSSQAKTYGAGKASPGTNSLLQTPTHYNYRPERMQPPHGAPYLSRSTKFGYSEERAAGPDGSSVVSCPWSMA